MGKNSYNLYNIPFSNAEKSPHLFLLQIKILIYFYTPVENDEFNLKLKAYLYY